MKKTFMCGCILIISMIFPISASADTINGETVATTTPGIPLLLLDTEPFALVSSSFSNGTPIPVQYSLQGGNHSPPVSWSNAPANTNSFVLIMDDPDAEDDTWDHWIIYDIPAETTSLAENAGAFGDGGLPSGASHGTNSWSSNYYQGPAPPSGTHRYYFKLYALSVSQLNPSGTDKAAIEAAMDGLILDQAELMGSYTYNP
jgi:Raf kinase inhibitor-like YbhB/YbcL family protein